MMFRSYYTLIIGAVLGLSLLAPASYAEQEHCFPQTGQCISGRFRQYWEQNGGLSVFGYPITPAREERNADTEETYLTQSFERNRFEYHPENERPYDVLLGRLGDARLTQLGREWQREGPESGPKAGCLWFEQTGHNVCNQSTSDDAQAGFLSYWQAEQLDDNRRDGYGRSLALHGLPLTEARLETNASGDAVLTQWFERARFEWHPNNPQGFRVLLGLLGTEVRGGVDQGKIVWSSDQAGNTDLYLLPMDQATAAGEPRRLTTDQSQDVSPELSPDGTQIVWMSDRDGAFEIYVMRVDGTDRRRLTNNQGRDMSPSWSPDGKRIVFVSYRDADNAEIYMMNADGSDQTRLTRHAGHDFDPAWSPDAKRIVWTSNRDYTTAHPAANDMYLMNADGSNIVRLTNDLHRNGTPAWSPDGKRIVFHRFDGGGFVNGDIAGGMLYVINVDGTEQRQLITDPQVLGGLWPGWSPDGTQIVFAAVRADSTTYDLFLTNPDGSRVAPLTAYEANDAEPSWSR